jgi:hypothetical protein
MKRIVSIEVLAPQRVRLRFDDGVEGVADLSRFAGAGVFVIWNDPAVWRQAVIGPAGRSLEWPGEVDLCADALWLETTGKSPEDLFPSLKIAATHA